MVLMWLLTPSSSEASGERCPNSFQPSGVRCYSFSPGRQVLAALSPGAEMITTTTTTTTWTTTTAATTTSHSQSRVQISTSCSNHFIKQCPHLLSFWNVCSREICCFIFGEPETAERMIDPGWGLWIVFISTYQVIQVVTFLSPNVGGHQQPLKGPRFHHPKKKVTAWITRYTGIPIPT